MAKVIRLHTHGGADALRYEDIEVGAPAAGEVRLRQTAIGLNFIDIYQRSGLYPLAKLPAVLGLEGAGVVTALGAGVTDFAVGDRVAYAGCPGGYASERLAPVDRLVKIPRAIADETAAAMMLKGMTVRYLFRETFSVTADTVMLFHAAAGGVGLIACQWTKALGATMIGTVSGDDKAQRAMASGCTHIINTARDDIVARVMDITGGNGVDVAYDSVGKDTYLQSLQCLRPKGLWVSFGNASGPVPPFDLATLKGSLFATRPSLFVYTAHRRDLVANAAELFSMVQAGSVKIAVNHTYPLADAAAAHRDLEGRRTTGSVVLIP